MGGFAPSAPQPAAKPEPEQPQQSDPQGSPANPFQPEQGFEGGEVAGTPPSDPSQNVGEANEGIFEMFQEMQMGLQNSSDFLMTLSGQFPGAAEPIRRVLEAMQGASQGIIDIIQAVTVEAAQPTPSAPRSSFG